MKTEIETPAKTGKKVEPKPIAARVALHPFLVGMNRADLALLTDCAIPVHFKSGQIILREYCETDHSLGYELFKRMSPIMLRRLQAAREKMLLLHAGKASLEPVV